MMLAGSAAEGEADVVLAGSAAEGEADVTPSTSLLMPEPMAVGIHADVQTDARIPLLAAAFATETSAASTAEGEADPMQRALETVDAAVVEIGLEDSADQAVDRLVRILQDDEDDFAAGADDLFGEIASSDEPA